MDSAYTEHVDREKAVLSTQYKTRTGQSVVV